MAEEMTVRECHQHGKGTHDYLEAVEKRHDEEIKEVKHDIKNLLANRLPPWVMFFISFLTLLLGALLGTVLK